MRPGAGVSIAPRLGPRPAAGAGLVEERAPFLYYIYYNIIYKAIIYNAGLVEERKPEGGGRSGGPGGPSEDKERSPGGGPGTFGLRSAGRRRGQATMEPFGDRRDATRMSVSVSGSNVVVACGVSSHPCAD